MEIDSFEIGKSGNGVSYVPDSDLVVVYLPSIRPPEFEDLLNDDCYLLSFSQYLRLTALYPDITIRALHPYKLEDDTPLSKRIYFHPAKVVEWLDEIMGYQPRIIDITEKLSSLYPNAKLIPLFENY